MAAIETPRFMAVVVLILATGGCVPIFGQPDLTKRITLTLDDIRLNELFDTLETVAGVPIAYSSDRILIDMRLTLRIHDGSLQTVIDHICSTGNLAYQVTKHMIVFRRRDSLPQKVEPPDDGPTHGGVSMYIMGGADSSTVLSVLGVSGFFVPLEVDPQLMTVPDFRRRANPSIKTGGRLGIGLTYAYDFDVFDFLPPPINFQQYRSKSHRRLGVGAYMLVLRRTYLTLEIAYSKRDFRLAYNFRVIDLDDPVPIPDETIVKLRYLEVPVSLGYRVYSRGSAMLLVTAGLHPWFLAHSGEVTTYRNHPGRRSAFFVDSSRSFVYGADVGLALYRSLSDFVGLFLKPSFFHSGSVVNEVSIETGFSMWRIMAGATWRM